MSMALFSSSPPPPTTLSALSLKPRLSFRTQLALFPRKAPSLLLPRSTDNGAGVVSSTATVTEEEEKKEETPPPAAEEKDVESKQQSVLGSNGAAARAEEVLPPKFKDPRWVGGTWDLKRFQKDGKSDWDGVVDAGETSFPLYSFDVVPLFRHWEIGPTNQMGNFFCKTLLFIAVAGVLLIRKNEDIDTLKRLLDETTFYDKQWQATWQEDKSDSEAK
ncbi:hypothetical protein BHE74_00025381 [Ensete ventricosum]|nr:hypothetical protein GW17_00012028 [Ensete ventricosum]RWW67185.1 hypothetical protein BHE74_00025381 [Ensete ventricosum]RZR87972.1 hypothetical protein BHM03_00015445 [Ensete ventricosum]